MPELNESSYFLALWQECQGSKSNCNMCIVPLKLCEQWNNELEGDIYG